MKQTEILYERNAINAPIQGSAADIIKVAMAKIYQRFKTEEIRSKMILQVHDELNFSVHPDEKEKVQQIVIEEMEKAYTMQVPLYQSVRRSRSVIFQNHKYRG